MPKSETVRLKLDFGDVCDIVDALEVAERNAGKEPQWKSRLGQLARNIQPRHRTV
jgi:hypothetical protein